MDEAKIIEQWSKELELDVWWKDLLGNQSVDSPETFNFDPAKEFIPWTEVVASEQIRNKIGHYLSYVEATKTWYAWDGRVHTPCDGEGLAYKLGKIFFETSRKALGEVEDMVNFRIGHLNLISAEESQIKKVANIYKEDFKKHRLYRDRLASDQGLSALVRMMRSDFDVPRNHYDMDQRFLVVKNCVFDMDCMRATGSVVPMKHSSHRPVTKYLDVVYDANVSYEESRWWSYLQSSVKDGDPETLRHLQKVVGAAFMGSNKLRVIINLKGPPSSGKSVFVETIWKMGKEGAGYCVMPDSRSITKVQGQNFEQDEFRGRRFIAISEPSSKEEIDDDFIKRYSGDEWVVTRTLHAKSDGWAPQGVIFVSSNATLKINIRDQAIVDRTQIIDFPYEFKDHPDPENPMEKKKDYTLSDTLATPKERSAILNWILWGQKNYFEDGRSLEPPLSVEMNKTALVSNGSSALRWLNEMFDGGDIVPQKTESSHAYVGSSEAFSNYQFWCGSGGERPLTKRYFEEDISHRYPIIKHGREIRFQGLMFSTQFRNKTADRGFPSPSATISDIP